MVLDRLDDDPTALPMTVTDVDPVLGALVVTCHDGDAASYDICAEIDPRCSCTVTAATRPASTPPLILAMIDDPDTHTDASDAVPPIRVWPDRVDNELARTPMMVTLVAPVIGALRLTTEVADGASYDIAPFSDVTALIDVATTPRPASTPPLILAVIDVPDTHTDASDAVPPIRVWPDRVEMPANPPTTVKLDPPVLGPLLLATLDGDVLTSYVTPIDNVPRA